jgi:hypothetical protein
VKVKALLGIIACIVALAGFTNFFASFNGRSLVPVGISHPLAMLAMAYLLFQHIFPAMIYRARPEIRARDTQTLLATGAILGKTTCGGYIGGLQFRGPLLGVEIYPGGVLIKPFLMPAVAIHEQEITAIRTHTVWFSEMVEIIHTSQSVASPVQLACHHTDPVRQMLFTRLRPNSISA